jgi:hypothetical protein
VLRKAKKRRISPALFKYAQIGTPIPFLSKGASAPVFSNRIQLVFGYDKRTVSPSSSAHEAGTPVPITLSNRMFNFAAPKLLQQPNFDA